MMTELQEEQADGFLALLWNFYGELDGAGDNLQKVRTKAWDHFLELGLPTRRDEVYRHVRLRSFFAHRYEMAKPIAIESQAIDPYVLPECAQSCLVFVNGHYSPSLSRLEGMPKKVVVTSLSDAMKTFGGFLSSQWSKELREEVDPFASLNLALHSNGAFLYVPPKTLVETPVQILHVVQAGTSSILSMPRVQVFVGAQSQLSLASTQAVLSGEGYATNLVVDMAIEEDAHVKMTQVACGEGMDIWHFDALRATLKRNSSLKTYLITDGAGTVRHDYRVALAGENAEAQLNGLTMLGGKREAHANILMDHQAPYCRSMQLFKDVLNNFSRSSFEGKIYVRQLAQKTEAFQLNNNLLLSEGASAHSKPNLEIFADDVKASHGSTVGQLDKEQIFYMKTRGFSEAAAKNILVYSFCQEVIEMIPIVSIQEAMKDRARFAGQ